MIEELLTQGNVRDKEENVGGSLSERCFLTLALSIMLNKNFHTRETGVKSNITTYLLFKQEFLIM